MEGKLRVTDRKLGGRVEGTLRVTYRKLAGCVDGKLRVTDRINFETELCVRGTVCFIIRADTFYQ